MRAPVVCCAALLAVCGLSCRAIHRAPGATLHARQALHGAGMNPFLLTNAFSSRLRVEVDWVEPRRPSPAALRTAEAVLREHCAAGKGIRVVADDAIPLERWEASAPGEAGLRELAAEYVDRDPRDWDEEELIWVLYVPETDRWFDERLTGLATRVTYEIGGEPRTVSVVLISSGRVRESALLWVGASRIERSTLIHELGHQLGLVSEPEHAKEGDARHCRKAGCVMRQPDLGWLLYNALPALFLGRIPQQFCKHCRAELRAARERWERAAASDPGWADALRAERRAESTARSRTALVD